MGQVGNLKLKIDMTWGGRVCVLCQQFAATISFFIIILNFIHYFIALHYFVFALFLFASFTFIILYILKMTSLTNISFLFPVIMGYKLRITFFNLIVSSIRFIQKGKQRTSPCWQSKMRGCPCPRNEICMLFAWSLVIVLNLPINLTVIFSTKLFRPVYQVVI